jgi:hypothetical protein
MKSLKRKPSIDQLKILNMLEERRKLGQTPTLYRPKWLEDYRVHRYLVRETTATNAAVTNSLFQVITLMENLGDVVHAIGVVNSKPTVLIMIKSDKLC